MSPWASRADDILDLPLTPATRKACVVALDYARRSRHGTLTSLHLLYGLFTATHGFPEWMRRRGVDVDGLVEMVRSALCHVQSGMEPLVFNRGAGNVAKMAQYLASQRTPSRIDQWNLLYTIGNVGGRTTVRILRNARFRIPRLDFENGETKRTAVSRGGKMRIVVLDTG
jgi:ATP-dependent Clp protease ATP-binding subunit ClpA